MELKDQKMIEGCYRRMYCAMIDKDEKGLDEVLDETFALVHMSGVRQPKEGFVSEVLDGTMNYFSAEHVEFNIKIDGEHATMTGYSIVDAQVYGGERGFWNLRQDLELIKRNDLWFITESKASAY
ncbi:nuclear transport factor 2 family protein [uncultured Bacteroides sp.]|uniref:nuclear transport factor 2 family protein n=1 Tax=uncultured Bacteroides sp. TaxID=162156 RepID=UPI0025F5670C|nr:nuclear transport factor 2 family protein [uncultured Bacteroides sp.]